MSKVKMTECRASLKGIAKKIQDLSVKERLPLDNSSY